MSLDRLNNENIMQLRLAFILKSDRNQTFNRAAAEIHSD